MGFRVPRSEIPIRQKITSFLSTLRDDKGVLLILKFSLLRIEKSCEKSVKHGQTSF